MTEGIRLEALEAKAERALEKMYQGAVGAREFAETMREIRRTQAYGQDGYDSFRQYYLAVWADKAKRSYSTVKNYISELYALEEFEAAVAERGRPDDYKLPDLKSADTLRSYIQDPAERVEAWEHFRENGDLSKPRGGLKDNIAEYKGEPTVRDVLTPDVMATIPSGKFDEFENWASETSKLVGPIHRMQPQEVADACERLYPEKIERHVAWADEIAQWYGAYRDELVARQRQGIRAVK